MSGKLNLSLIYKFKANHNGNLRTKFSLTNVTFFSLSRTQDVVSPDWQTGNTRSHNWRVYNFIADEISGCAEECFNENSARFVRRLSARSPIWLGVILCDSQRDEFKLMLANSLDGVFRKGSK